MTDQAASHSHTLAARQWRWYVRTAWHALVSMADVGLLVVGSALVGLAAVVILEGFGVVRIGLTASIGAALGSGLVIAVFGAFGLGVAAEGPVGRGLRGEPATEVEAGIAAGLATVVVGFLLLLAASRLSSVTSDLPQPFEEARRVLHAAGRAGWITAPLAGVGIWLGRRRFGETVWWIESETPLHYVAWAVLTMILL